MLAYILLSVTLGQLLPKRTLRLWAEQVKNILGRKYSIRLKNCLFRIEMNAHHLISIISKYCSLCKNKVKTKDDISIIKLSTRRLQEITLPFGFYPSVIIIMIIFLLLLLSSSSSSSGEKEKDLEFGLLCVRFRCLWLLLC